MNATRAAPPEGLTFRTKFLYGLGSISFGVHVYVLSLLLFFYNQVIGLPAGWVSLALSVTLVVDAAWDPILGQISDGLRTRWGRRHPLMYLSAFPVAVTMLALWRPPASFSNPEKALWLFGFAMLCRLVISLYEVPSQALAPELAPDYHERTSLLAYRWVFFTVGGGVAVMLGYFIFFRPTPQYPQGQLNPAAWGPMTFTAAALMFGSILISALGTHDRIGRLHQPAIDRRPFKEVVATAFATLRNRNLGVAMSAALFGGLSYGIYLGLELYVATFFWRLPASAVGLLSLANLLSVFPGAILATAATRWRGKRLACIGLFFLSMLLLQGPILAKLLGAFPANGSAAYLPTLMAIRFAHGMLTNAGFIVATSMIADITEDSQVKTGRRSEGLVMAINSFVTKTTTGVSALLPGLMLAFVGFPAVATAKVAPAIVDRLMWVYLPSTALLSALSIAVWFAYRIDQKTHEANLAAVAAAEARMEATSAAPTAAA